MQKEEEKSSPFQVSLPYILHLWSWQSSKKAFLILEACLTNNGSMLGFGQEQGNMLFFF